MAKRMDAAAAPSFRKFLNRSSQIIPKTTMDRMLKMATGFVIIREPSSVESV